MAKTSEGSRKPHLPDHGGDDKTYKPRSVSTKVEQPKDGAFPERGGRKPMLNAADDMTHLGASAGTKKGQGH
jgi:hypothetical protein